MKSPCNKVCVMDAAGRYCLGCWRTLAEVTAWPGMSEAEQREVVAQLEARRLAAARNDSAKSSA
ncbi:MAG TPA: DUF1289 domain-containing protein [Burkholderiales bacterium]